MPAGRGQPEARRNQPAVPSRCALDAQLGLSADIPSCVSFGCAADEWGSGWGGNGSSGNGNGPQRQQQPGAKQQSSTARGEEQWGGWDEGTASPSHMAGQPTPAKDDEWGKW